MNRSVIQQTVVLPATAEKLFEMYLDPAAHEVITGSAVTIGEKEGSEFSAFDGALTGTILTVVRPRLIVQSWRSKMFHDKNPDSTLILTFSPEDDNGRIDLVHLDVPDHDFQSVTEGWKKYYFEPWQRYLESQ